MDQGTRTFHGLYVLAAWLLTHDHRLFEGQRGIWGRVTPRCDAFTSGC